MTSGIVYARAFAPEQAGAFSFGTRHTARAYFRNRNYGGISSGTLSILRKADAIYLYESRKAEPYDAIWQAFAVLLPVSTMGVKSVMGVMGDGRTYDYGLGFRAFNSNDGMTAESYPFDHSFFARAATRSINEGKGVRRVVYYVTSKPTGTIDCQ